MPYITQEDRVKLLKADKNADNVGELNYIITGIILDYVYKKGLRYATINDIKGVLDSVKDEFTRRIVGIYEDVKKEENGDIDMYEYLTNKIKGV